MSISIRLEKPIEEALRKQIKTQKATLSAYVRDAILEKIEREKQLRPNPYELGKTLFGRYSSDRSDLSTNRKAILKEKLRAKHRH
ncbi:DUF6290 family protein [Leucothrix pacifica]|uniref:CopG family transcriptional regulator n=1 Tax=Leucothrix pacifica TaxID=1247513 RepID=A0A317C806_9GAMM|nr:DUF6290 family protein [Leucothrix pacifica]PWQ92440.1 CopG family transcriptional regulator [Leucothrix pacifica]